VLLDAAAELPEVVAAHGTESLAAEAYDLSETDPQSWQRIDDVLAQRLGHSVLRRLYSPI